LLLVLFFAAPNNQRTILTPVKWIFGATRWCRASSRMIRARRLLAGSSPEPPIGRPSEPSGRIALPADDRRNSGAGALLDNVSERWWFGRKRQKQRLKPLRYLSFLAYAVPTKLQDRVYNFFSRRRRKWFGSASECLLFDNRFDERFVDDGVLTGNYCDPFYDPNADPPAAAPPKKLGLFDGESPPVRGTK
jgi:hypothetical protein